MLHLVYEALVALARKRVSLLEVTSVGTGLFVSDIFHGDFILINPNLTIRMKVQVLAHELGHCVLHGSSAGRMYHDEDRLTEDEAEADAFASRLIDSIQYNLEQQSRWAVPPSGFFQVL